MTTSRHRTAKGSDGKKTKLRILKKSLQLFNKHGVRNISAHTIAAELAVSVGNVTYYFAKKTDIVDGLSSELQQEMVEVLSITKSLPGSQNAIADSVLQFIELFWKYRFFFADLMFITQSDERQRQRYFDLKQTTVAELCKAHLHFEEVGAAQPIAPPNTLHWTMENLWYAWISYLQIFLVENTSSRAAKQKYITFAALHMYSFMAPYYTDQVRDGIYQQLTSGQAL